MVKGKRKHILHHSKVPSIKIRSLLIRFPLRRSGLLVDFRAYEEVLRYRHFSVSWLFVTQRILKKYEYKIVSDAAIDKTVLKQQAKRNKGKKLKDHHLNTVF